MEIERPNAKLMIHTQEDWAIAQECWQLANTQSR